MSAQKPAKNYSRTFSLELSYSRFTFSSEIESKKFSFSSQNMRLKERHFHSCHALAECGLAECTHAECTLAPMSLFNTLAPSPDHFLPPAPRGRPVSNNFLPFLEETFWVMLHLKALQCTVAVSRVASWRRSSCPTKYPTFAGKQIQRRASVHPPHCISLCIVHHCTLQLQFVQITFETKFLPSALRHFLLPPLVVTQTGAALLLPLLPLLLLQSTP